MNEALLVELIREKGVVSRAELARLSGLTKPTVSSQVAGLLQRGVVKEEGAGEPDERGGKPPTLLRFNAECGHLIAAEIGSLATRVWLTDLNGERLDCQSRKTRPEMGAAQVLRDTQAAIEAVLARGRGRKGKLVAAAIAAPGRVDAKNGAVLEAGNVFHWRDVAVRQFFERALEVPVLVENDVNLAALGEMHAGVAQGVADFVLVRLGTGVGAGLVLGGRLYAGHHWAAGEIGHLIFDRAAAERVDDRGHLERSIGSDQVRERLKPALPEADRHDLAGVLSEAIRRRDPVASAVVEDLACQLGVAIADLAAVIDPALIVLDGEMFALVLDQIREVVGRVVTWPVRVERSALGDDAALLGAVGMARSVGHEIVCGRGRGEMQPKTRE